jgi:hypothetical protein
MVMISLENNVTGEDPGKKKKVPREYCILSLKQHICTNS